MIAETLLDKFPVPVRRRAGWQCVIDLHGCGTQHLDDVDWVRNTMLEAARRAQATVVSEQFHRFEPHGISGVVVIGESHLAVHIWPERRFAALDVFTCNSRLHVAAAASWLVEAFAARESQFVRLERGCAGIVADGSGLPGDSHIDHQDECGGHWFVRRRVIAAQRTAHQEAEIVELEHFGRALFLDGKLQSAERDEYIYHEALVHPALCLHKAPRRVLIIGGGEGATAREVLKHPSVEDIVMVDLDRDLIGMARRHLESWHRNCFEDPRLRLVIADGFDFISGTVERFDVVIIDVIDSFEGGPAEALYGADFYRMLKRSLAADGIVVVQAMECDACEWKDHARVRANLQNFFSHARSYTTFVPSFWSTWGFVLASDAHDPDVSADSVDAIIAGRGLASQLRFFDGRTHQGLFALAKDVRLLLGGS